MYSPTINPALLFVHDPFAEQLKSRQFEWLPSVAPSTFLPPFTPLHLEYCEMSSPEPVMLDFATDSSSDSSSLLEELSSDNQPSECFSLVTHSGGPIQHQRGGKPVVELRSERKRKSRTLLYLRSTNHALAGRPCRIEIHSDKIEPTLIGDLQSKDGGSLLEISEFMELVVPPYIMLAMDQHKLTSSRFPSNLVYLKLIVDGEPSQNVHFYREKRMTRKRKLETEAF
jgi:hypothetical protein